ncbi:11293_t:CDS:2, partial [Funneliformis geosporum]
ISNEVPGFIVTVWVLFEGKKSTVEVDLDQTNYVTHNLNLDRLKPVLKEEFNELRNVERSDIEFFSYDDHNTLTPLCIGTLLIDLVTTYTSPLVIRYSLSNANSFYKAVIIIEYHIQVVPGFCFEKLFKKDEELETCGFYFVVKINSKEETIDNEFQFNSLVVRTDSDDRGDRFLDLKIQVKDIYNDAFNSIDSMPTLKIEEVFKLEPPLNDDDLKRVKDNLRKKMTVFHSEVTTNEATAREFISVFLSLVVNHVCIRNDPSTRLKVEFTLNGSCGYGVLDYGIYIQKIPVLVTVAKPHENERAVAQTLVQIHSVVESMLGKRKRSETDPEQTMFGIVTTGRSWRFIRWIGTLKSPKAEITKEYPCIFEGDMKEAKNVASHIVRILQAQAKSLTKEEPCSKRLCADNKSG